MRGTIATGLALALTAFAPPERPPASLEPTQQQAIPKSWIPEQKPGQAPPITLEATPRQRSAYSHAHDLKCADTPGLAASARKFVESYQGARVAIEDKRFDDAIRFAEIAAQNANGAREWMAVENLRVLAFIAVKNDTELVATLEAVLSSKGCLTAAQEANFRSVLEDARSRMAAPR